MESSNQESSESKEPNSNNDKTSAANTDKKEEALQVSSTVVSSSSSHDDSSATKRPFFEADSTEVDAEDEGQKRKKKKESDMKEPTSKNSSQSRTATGRGLIAGSKPPGPASKTGATPLGKNASGQSGSNSAKSHSGSSGKTSAAQNKGNTTGSASGKSLNSTSAHQGKQSNKNSNNLTSKGVERKSPVPSPKQNKEIVDDDESKQQESNAPKVPPLKIVIPGGVGAGNQQEGESVGQRGSSKSRGSVSTLPYIIPCSAEDDDDKKNDNITSAQQRVLRSHRTTDGDKERPSPPASSMPASPANNKTPPPADEHTSNVSNSNPSGNQNTPSHPVELHPRKRKIKSSRDNHAHQNTETASNVNVEHTIHTSSNPYQQYLHIRKQIDRRQKNLFPVQPKPPQGFKDYLMNRATYTLESTAKPGPAIIYPATLPVAMRDEFSLQEKERHQIRIQHNVEKEKLVLSVEQEILRVHGRAARALANQSLPFSVCTVLRDREVYNIQTPEQEEKERNAQRSRYNGRLFLSWLQDVDDKWEKIKEDMVRRHHNEAQSLHATQKMNWLWKLQELGLPEYKSQTEVDLNHVPPVHVSDDFDLLPA